jgi:hypothetical protein
MYYSYDKSFFFSPPLLYGADEGKPLSDRGVGWGGHFIFAPKELACVVFSFLPRRAPNKYREAPAWRGCLNRAYIDD